jgi:hypothetical protein
MADHEDVVERLRQRKLVRERGASDQELAALRRWRDAILDLLDLLRSNLGDLISETEDSTLSLVTFKRFEEQGRGRRRRSEPVSEETAGWILGSYGDYCQGVEVSEKIWLLIDGRIVRTERDSSGGTGLRTAPDEHLTDREFLRLMNPRTSCLRSIEVVQEMTNLLATVGVTVVPIQDPPYMLAGSFEDALDGAQ